MANNLELSYNANGGSGAPATQNITGSATSTGWSYSTTLRTGRSTRTYYNFLGWATSSSASSAQYQPGGTFTRVYAQQGSYAITLYAVWEHQNVTLSFNANGGTGAPNPIVHWGGYSVKIPNTVPTRTGYTFLGWSLSSTATTATYQPGQDAAIYGNATLYAVWQVASSTVTASDGTLGTAQTLTISRTQNYADTITYSFGNAAGTIVELTTASSVSWTPPLSFASQIPNATSGACVLTCTSYNNGVLVGSSQTTINLSVPASVKVAVDTVTLAETVSAIASAFGAFVQTKSKIKVTVAGDTTGAYGATIAAYSININGQTLGANEAVTNEISGYGTLSYSVTITDTRGRTDTTTGTYNVLAYNEPSASATAERVDATPTSITVNWSCAISPVNDLNGKTVKIYYKEQSASTYTQATQITPSTYMANGTYTITGTNRALPYDVKIEVSDTLSSASYVTAVAAYGSRIFHISAVDKSIVVHGYNTSDGKDHWKENVLVFDEGIEIGSTGLSEAQLISLLASAIKSVDIPVSSFSGYGSYYYAAVNVSSYGATAFVSAYNTDWDAGANNVLAFTPQGNNLLVWFATNTACTVKLLYI